MSSWTTFLQKDKKNNPFGTERTWHAPATGHGRKAGLPMVKLPRHGRIMRHGLINVIMPNTQIAC